LGDGAKGITRTVDATNSLVGSNANDAVGYNRVTALSNGNYVVISPMWDGLWPNGRGAATWGDGAKGITGIVDATNSLVGSNAGDHVGGGGAPGRGGVVALSNGNYVVASPDWSNHRGAVTWGDGTMGITGFVDETNSLIG